MMQSSTRPNDNTFYASFNPSPSLPICTYMMQSSTRPSYASLIPSPTMHTRMLEETTRPSPNDMEYTHDICTFMMQNSTMPR